MSLKNNNSEKEIADSRRDFLMKSALAGMAVALNPLSNMAQGVLPAQLGAGDLESIELKSNKISILITSDIHSQLNTHDEFFWENNTSVYRKRGGLAVLKTMIETFRKQNPTNTILYDGGDFFHGHAVASLTEGEALIPIFNELNYDLMLPGNWEVVYKKKKMLYDLGHVNAAK
ncbi:MAG: metallophosphoesterase, partial [Bacteroidota bacterium]